MLTQGREATETDSFLLTFKTKPVRTEIYTGENKMFNFPANLKDF